MNKITITTKHFLILCLFFIFNLNVFAQNNISSIKGKVIDENKAPLPYVSVAVYQDDKIITGAITNDDGVFTLKVQQSHEELRLTFDFVACHRCLQYLQMGSAFIQQDLRFNQSQQAEKQNAVDWNIL